jgi:superoxide reductase
MISIQVGSVEHPMEEDHYIAFAYLETEKGGQRKNFKPGEPPRCEFRLKDDSPVAVYAYCNKHGLWAREKKFKSPPPVDMLTMRG